MFKVRTKDTSKIVVSVENFKGKGSLKCNTINDKLLCFETFTENTEIE